MAYLALVSLVWAVSFGLIKGQLAGIDSNLVAFIRLFLSLLVFLPFLKTHHFRRRRDLSILFAIGAIQYGLMYALYIASYAHLLAHEIALFTLTTPIFVVLVDDALERRFQLAPLAAAALSVIAAGVLKYRAPEKDSLALGFLLMQASNLCFALGQVWYRRAIKNAGLEDVPQHQLFAVAYLGAAVVPGIATLFTADLHKVALSPSQALTLLYLGVVSSGICFFLWNLGATKTSTGLLAVMNNAKIPLGVLASLALFHESADPARLVVAGALFALAFVLAERGRKHAAEKEEARH